MRLTKTSERKGSHNPKWKPLMFHPNLHPLQLQSHPILSCFLESRATSCAESRGAKGSFGILSNFRIPLWMLTLIVHLKHTHTHHIMYRMTASTYIHACVYTCCIHSCARTYTHTTSIYRWLYAHFPWIRQYTDVKSIHSSTSLNDSFSNALFSASVCQTRH